MRKMFEPNKIYGESEGPRLLAYTTPTLGEHFYRNARNKPARCHVTTILYRQK